MHRAPEVSMDSHKCIRAVGQAVVLLLGVLFIPPISHAAVCEQHAKSVGDYIPVRELGDWDVIDARTVLIWVPGTARAHLVRLSRPLPMLNEAEELIVVGGGRDKVILPCGRDAVEIDDDPSTLTVITEIEPLSEKGAAELLRKTSLAISS
jgi:Family of unknown function (DUF6491)